VAQQQGTGAPVKLMVSASFGRLVPMKTPPPYSPPGADTV
jgi:hypothetical protein